MIPTLTSLAGSLPVTVINPFASIEPCPLDAVIVQSYQSSKFLTGIVNPLLVVVTAPTIGEIPVGGGRVFPIMVLWRPKYPCKSTFTVTVTACPRGAPVIVMTPLKDGALATPKLAAAVQI